MQGSKKKRLAGWIVTGIVALFLVGPSAVGKFVEWEGKEEMFEHLGYSQTLINKIGVLEIALAVLLMIPRTGFLAAVLLTGYLGGAVATHIRVVDPWIQCAVPVILGIVMWVGMGLRQPGIFSMTAGGAGKTRAEAERD